MKVIFFLYLYYSREFSFVNRIRKKNYKKFSLSILRGKGKFYRIPFTVVLSTVSMRSGTESFHSP